MLENGINAGTVYDKIEVIFMFVTPLLFDKINAGLQDGKDLIRRGYFIKLPSILGKTTKGTSYHDAAPLFCDPQCSRRADPDTVTADFAVVFIDDRSPILEGDDPVQAGLHAALTLAAFLIGDFGFCYAVDAYLL